jgi:hypothetical protein
MHNSNNQVHITTKAGTKLRPARHQQAFWKLLLLLLQLLLLGQAAVRKTDLPTLTCPHHYQKAPRRQQVQMPTQPQTQAQQQQPRRLLVLRQLRELHHCRCCCCCPLLWCSARCCCHPQLRMLPR